MSVRELETSIKTMVRVASAQAPPTPVGEKVKEVKGQDNERVQDEKEKDEYYELLQDARTTIFIESPTSANKPTETKGARDFRNKYFSLLFGQPRQGEKSRHPLLDQHQKDQGSPDGYVLHRVARQSPAETGNKSYLEFLRWILLCNLGDKRRKDGTIVNYSLLPLLYTKASSSDWTPLHAAFAYKNDFFVDQVLEAARTQAKVRKTVLEVLRSSAHNGCNCLHLAIQNSSEHIRQIIGICSTKVGGDGSEESEESSIFTQRGKVSAGLGLSEKATPLHHVLASTDVLSTQERLDIIKALIQAQRKSLETKTEGPLQLTPYQYRLQLLKDKVEAEISWHASQDPNISPIKRRQLNQESANRLRELVNEDEFASYIRMFCISQLPREDALKALYIPGQERNIDFDLSGLQNQSISTEYLDSLAVHLRFESVLKYVALPKLTVDLGKEEDREKHSKGKGLRDLVKIFNWLRKNHVKKIIKVIVVDDGDVAHSDSAIRDCVKGFDVLKWDWKKVDLCSEVIYEAARNVEEVTLYSSGNNAVLLGWSSTDGFLKFPKLKKIRLYYRLGLEDPIEYVKRFKGTIEDWPNEWCEKCKMRTTKGHADGALAGNRKIWVELIKENEANPVVAGFRDAQVTPESDNEWMRCAKDFAVFLRNIKGNNLPEVKIALIDSGIDATLNMFRGRIALGKSFCRYPDSGECFSQYYVPSDSHGTKMAYFICQVFPKVRLYIARLDNTEASHGRQQFTAKSAAEAIDWAVQCGVDIISMSWTIESKAAEGQEMTLLQGAVKSAHDREILMFCSADDKGAVSSGHCYPSKWDNSIVVGAANDTGSVCDWVPANKDGMFIFPGLNIPFCSGHTSMPDSLESGSSVATAIASGLAGVLLFCDRLLKAELDSPTMQSAVKFQQQSRAANNEEADSGSDVSVDQSDGEVEAESPSINHKPALLSVTDRLSPFSSPKNKGGFFGAPSLLRGQSEPRATSPIPIKPHSADNLRTRVAMIDVLSNMSSQKNAEAKYPRIDQYFDERFKHWSWNYHRKEASKVLEEMMKKLKEIR